MNSNWWCATLIVCSSVKDSLTDMYICDEQVHLLRAINFEIALSKAIAIGKDQEHSYESIDGHLVTWQFLGVSELEEIEDIVDGIEIKSKLVKTPDPNELVLYKP